MSDIPIPAAKPAANPADLGAIAVCSLIWGTTWFAITLQLGVVPPVVSIVYRFALAALLLFGWLAATRQPMRLNRAQHLAVFGQGCSPSPSTTAWSTWPRSGSRRPWWL